MKHFAIIALALLATACSSTTAEQEQDSTLAEMFEGKFRVGVALNRNQIYGIDSVGAAVAARNFNSIVAEDVMKCEKMHPADGEFFWDDADAFVRYGQENNMFMVGHCLIWHSQCAPWFTVDSLGNLVDAETMKARMQEHISTIMGRYKGKIQAWDVVNEAILDDGSYRNSDFYKILGEEYIPLAFQYAHEADPDAELYINDFSMSAPGKRDAYVRIARELKERGLRIDAIGMQGHIGMDYPDFNMFEASIDSFAATGCKVMITELDMSALPTINTGANVSETVDYAELLNPYPEVLPDSVANVWNSRMERVFDIALKHADVISRVTAWGVCDGDSWKNGWPMEGRRDYPLLFDRNYNMKPFLNKYK